MTFARQCEQLVGKVELGRRWLAAREIELQPLGQQRVVRSHLLFMQGCQFIAAEIGQRKHRFCSRCEVWAVRSLMSSSGHRFSVLPRARGAHVYD